MAKVPKPKILIAEDEQGTRKLYDLGLPDHLCERHLAVNGQEALDKYKELKPDILVLDISMPILNGYQVLKKIRTELGDKKTTVIMVTGSAEKDDIVACAKLDIQGYIIKPFKVQELAKAIFGYHKKWINKVKV